MDEEADRWGLRRPASPVWDRLVRELGQRLAQTGADFEHVRAAQRFGLLKVRALLADGAPEEIREQVRVLIDAAERLAAETCEECSAAGALRRERSYVQTLCDQCAAAREEPGWLADAVRRRRAARA